MAKYCRYCGSKVKDLRDNFCYDCRKAGVPVGFLYRFAKKPAISEEEKDLIRVGGAELALSAGIMCLFLGSILIFYFTIVSINKEEPRFPVGVEIALVAVAAVFVVYIIFGLGLVMLDKRFVRWEWEIYFIMFFFALFHSRRDGFHVVTAAITAPKKFARENELGAALQNLASERRAKELLPPKPLPTEWVCKFCGYKNSAAAFECKSCGKIK